MMRAIGRLTAAMAVCAFAAIGWAEVNIETVKVGNPGNAGEPSGGVTCPPRICGAVDYVYDIGKYEVTAGQYTEFLNAVAASDTYDLYNPWMWWSDSFERGCGIERAGSPGNYTYSVAPDWADRPVTWVSWGDAARFCNWLHNGQPTGPQELGTTEDGSYFLDGATTTSELVAVTRDPDATWAIPSEDEWYKAAYHRNDGATGNYWDYPTGTDTVPHNDLVDPDPGNNATFYVGSDDWTIGDPYFRTVVGAHENSESPYGTFDQGGNVDEWNEEVMYGAWRGWRGGAFLSDSGSLHATDRPCTDYQFPDAEYPFLGFRVVPEPTSLLLLLALGAPGLLRRR